MKKNRLLKWIGLITLLSQILFYTGCTPTPKNEIGKDFLAKKKQIKIAMNTFQGDKAVSLLESMNEHEQEKLLEWLPTDESDSLQRTRIRYLLIKHTQNSPKVYRVTTKDTMETKKAFDLLMKTLHFDKTVIRDLYKNNNMDFFQGIIESMAKEIKRGHKYNEAEIFKMVQSQNGRVKPYMIDVNNYFPTESTLYGKHRPSTAGTIEERKKERKEELKAERAYKLKISRMTPVKFYMVNKYKNNIIFQSFKTVSNDKNLKFIDLKYKIKEKGENQYYFFTYDIRNKKRELEHTKIDCYLSDEKMSYINDFDEFKRIRFFKTGVINLNPKEKKNSNHYVVKIIKESSTVRFIKNNLEDLKNQITQGKGKKLDALAKFYPVINLASWKKTLQKNYAKIFTHNINNQSHFIEKVSDIIFRLTIFDPQQRPSGISDATVVPVYN